MKAVFALMAILGIWQMVRLHRAERSNRVQVDTIAAMDRANAALAQQNEMLGEALQELTATSKPVSNAAAPATTHPEAASDRPTRRWNDGKPSTRASLLWDDSVTYDPTTNQFLDAEGKPI